MSLRVQLLLFGVLTLALPWAGFEFVQQMEGALRQGLESSLLASAGTAARALGNDDSVVWEGTTGTAGSLYAHRLASAPRIDGYVGDWILARLRATPIANAAFVLGDASVWVGAYGRFAYLALAVADPDIVYPVTPGTAPFGDRIVVLVGSDAQPESILLSTAAPGQFRAQRTRPGRFVPVGGYEDRVLAAWQESGDGFTVEARIPLELLDGGLGIAVIDVDGVAGALTVGIDATWAGDEPAPGRLVLESGRVAAALDRLGRVGDRYRVIDKAAWVLADSGTLDGADAAQGDAGPPLSERLLRAILRRNDPLYDGLERPLGRVGASELLKALDGETITSWYRRGPASQAIVAAAVPVTAGDEVVGALILEQASDSVLTLSNRARTRLMVATVVASLAAAAALLAYASFLSFRIGRLARAAETALAPSGEIRVRLPGAAARDEIGDLSRRFGDLLGRLSAYTDYLRTLTSKLAHEIRTPITIVSTSLDNLEREPDATAAKAYLARIRQGTARLDAILSAMSAATRIEQAVNEAAAERYDLARVVRACTDAYADAYQDRRFEVVLTQTPCPVFGSSDLLAQLLDKLVDNAVGFSEPDSVITITVRDIDDMLELSVANPGPPLPESMQHQVFDSLVSVRENRDGGTHLGLGLYIVALIAKYHRGTVEAENLPGASGVVVSIKIPRSRDRGRADDR